MPAKASSYFNTTRLPDFKEVVYQFDSSKIDYSLQMVASISVFLSSNAGTID